MKSEKITEQGLSRRRYDDSCAAALALDLVGDRWALLVMRELMLGSRRFSDLRADLPGLSANVLTQRLEELEAARVLRRVRLPPPAAAQVYELTAWGYDAEPILQALGRWAVRSPLHDPTLPISPVSLCLSFRTMIDPARAAGIEARIGFRMGGQGFLSTLSGGRLDIARGPAGDADAVFTGSAPAIGAAVYGPDPLARLVEAGILSVEGDLALAERFAGCFALPDKFDPAGAGQEPSPGRRVS